MYNRLWVIATLIALFQFPIHSFQHPASSFQLPVSNMTSSATNISQKEGQTVVTIIDRTGTTTIVHNLSVSVEGYFAPRQSIPLRKGEALIEVDFKNIAKIEFLELKTDTDLKATLISTKGRRLMVTVPAGIRFFEGTSELGPFSIEPEAVKSITFLTEKDAKRCPLNENHIYYEKNWAYCPICGAKLLVYGETVKETSSPPRANPEREEAKSTVEVSATSTNRPAKAKGRPFDNPLSTKTSSKSKKTEPRATITTPEDGDEVPRVFLSKGNYENLPAEYLLWLLVIPPDKEEWYPQPLPTLLPKGQWSCKLTIGRMGTIDKGKEFQIQVVAADKAQSKVFSKALTTGAPLPIDSTIKVLAQVRVIRK